MEDVKLNLKFDTWTIGTYVLCSGPSNWWQTFLGRNWHEVKHVGVAELQLICLHAREKELDSLQVMVPVPVDISLSHERWGYVQCLDATTTQQVADNLLKGEVGENNEYHKQSNISACKRSYFGYCKHIFKVEIFFFF